MVLPGYALMALGTQIHIASWPGGDDSRHEFLSRAFASQAAAYVIDVGATLAPDLVPKKYRELAYEQLGESCIIDPYGEIIAGPAEGETILVADCSMEDIYKAKALCDAAGHYSRPDVFQLLVNKRQPQQVVDMKVSDRELDVSGEPESG
jgi:predicted amidohydrolase